MEIKKKTYFFTPLYPTSLISEINFFLLFIFEIKRDFSYCLWFKWLMFFLLNWFIDVLELTTTCHSVVNVLLFTWYYNLLCWMFNLRNRFFFFFNYIFFICFNNEHSEAMRMQFVAIYGDNNVSMGKKKIKIEDFVHYLYRHHLCLVVFTSKKKKRYNFLKVTQTYKKSIQIVICKDKLVAISWLMETKKQTNHKVFHTKTN